nr:hypothetical protein Iba_chr05aCG7560 [Ipomoea batatas]
MLQDVLPSPLVGGSREGLFTGLDSDVIGFRLTRLTPLPTTPRLATCEELIATDAELLSAPFAFAATIPRISWRIDRPVSVSISASLSWEESVDCNILDDSAAVLSDGTVWPGSTILSTMDNAFRPLSKATSARADNMSTFSIVSPDCFSTIALATSSIFHARSSKSAYSRDPTEGFDEFSPFSLFSESERPSVLTPASMVSRILSGEEPLPSEFTTSSAIDERRQRKPSR